MEFISLANLINLVIVILMLALYRYFDKNNRSLEKVKRFTDKVKENLSGFVDEKTEEIRNLSIDMKVNLTTAKEVLNRIGSIEVELKNKAESIDTLHKQVNKYDTLIRELNTATIVVEENLKRIHDESTFVDKVGKRIKTAQGKIDLLEKAIPVVREEIKKQNSEDLKKISDKLTQDVTQKTKSIHDVMQGVEKKVKDFSVYITRLEGRKDTMEQESIKKFDSECGKFEARMLQKKAEVAKSFKDELSGYLQEAQAQRSVHKKNMDELVQESQVEIADLEDRMLKHLIEFKKDIEQAELNFKTNLSRVVESGKNLEHDIFTELREKIKVDAEKVHGEVGKKLVGFGKEVDVRNNELIAILGKAKQNTEVWKTGIEKNIEKITQELTTSFENNKAELEATITEFIHQNEDSRKVYGAQLDDFITVSEDKMQMLESEYTKKMSDMNKSFSQFKNDYTQQLKDVDSEFEKEKEEMLLHFNETMKTVEKQCALRFEQVKKDFDQIDGVSEDIKFRMKNIKKDLQECSCDLLGKIDEFKHTFSDDLSNASTELESVIIKKVDKRISDYEKDASYRFDKLEQVQTDIESLEQGLRDLMEIKKEELKSDFSEFITHLDEKKKEEREYTNKILSEIRVEIQNLEEEVHELKAKAYQSVSEKLKVFEDDFFTDLKSRNQDMEKSIEEWRSSVKEKLQLLAAQHEQGRLEIEEKYNAEIQTEMSGLEAKTKELFTLFKKQWKETLSGEFKTYKSEFSQNSVEFKKEVDDILLEIKNNFSSQRDSITKEADKEREIITEEIASLNVKIDAYKSDFDRNTEDYKEEVKNIILDIKDNFTSQRDTIIKEAHEESKIIDNEILSLNTKLDEYKEEFYRNTKDLKDEVKDIIADITNNFASRRDTIIKETNEESKIIDEEITSLKMKLEAYKTEFNKNTEDYKEEVEDMILTIKNDFSSGRDELFKETEEKGQVLNDKLEKLGQRLDVFDSKFSDRTNNVLRDFQSKYEQKQGDFTKRLRELQSEFELKIKDFKTTIAQGTTMVSAAQKEQKSELKSMEDQIKNLNKQLNLAAKDALSTCNTEFHKLQEEFISRMKTFDESMVKKIAGFDASFKSSQEKVKLSHDKYAERVDGEYKA
ncbi:MAG: hypothetical protein JXJ04_10010, partial [Spirochaetales bacterium]|nr:hypothetical protein [Spirochaetales bacterium]